MDNSVYVALSSQLSQFRDMDVTANNISLGGNAITPAGATGYDLVTGLGTPNVANLVKDILLDRAGE